MDLAKNVPVFPTAVFQHAPSAKNVRQEFAFLQSLDFVTVRGLVNAIKQEDSSILEVFVKFYTNCTICT